MYTIPVPQIVCISLCKKRAIFLLQDCFAWGFPLLLVMVFARLYLLGYGESADIGKFLLHVYIKYYYIIKYTGWCYVSLRTMTSNLRADQTLLLAYEVWGWLSLSGILIFSLAYLAVACCKKRGLMCYRQDTTNADSSQLVQVRHSRVIITILFIDQYSSSCSYTIYNIHACTCTLL